MPHVHHLKAHDFSLVTWKRIEECPRDGSTFIAKGMDDVEHEVHWDNGIVSHGSFLLCTLLVWRRP